MKADHRPRRGGRGNAALSLFRGRPGRGMHEDERARWLMRVRPAPRQARSADDGWEWRAQTWECLHGRPVRQITRRPAHHVGCGPRFQGRLMGCSTDRICRNAACAGSATTLTWVNASRAIGRFSATLARSPLFGPIIPNTPRPCSDDLAPCPTSCDLRKVWSGARPLAAEHTAGKVRGHASLMQPTKPSPGVPFVALPLYHGPNAHHDTIAALSAEVESLNLPSAWLANVIAARGDLAMLLRSVSPVKPDHPRAGSRRRSNCTVFRARFLMRRSHCVVRSGSK